MKINKEELPKKILFIAMSIFLVSQSYNLLLNVSYTSGKSWGYLFLAAWIITLFITGIFAFAVFALPVERLLPKSYYTVRQPKQLKKWCKTLKIEWFRKALLATLWRSKSQRDKYFNGRLDGIENLELQSKKSEFGHILPFIIINLVCVYFLIFGYFRLTLLTLIINIIGNFYPVLLQRHHRMRIAILKRRYKKK